MAKAIDFKDQQDLPLRVALWTLTATLALSCGLDLFFFSGFFASDDIGYLAGAWNVLNGEQYASSPPLSMIRLTMTGWNTLIAWLFGYHVQGIAGSYIFFHQLVIVCTFVLARRMHDNAVAVLASFWMATTSLAVTFSTAILPDLPLAAFVLAALLLFQWPYARGAARSAGASFAAIFAAGVCVGLGYMAKESSLILLPYFFVFWICNEWGRPKSRALLHGIAFLAGFGAVFAAEWAILSHLTGHSYFRMGWTVGENQFDGALRKFPDGYYPLERLFRLRDKIAPWFEITRLHYALAAGALAYPFVQGRRWAVWTLGLWFFVYHTWGSTRLSDYLPTSLQPRYFIPVMPFLFIMLSFLAVKAWRALPRWIAAPRATGAIQGMLTLVLFLYPLLSLCVSDKMAGKIYRADFVNVSYRAIQAAQAAGDRPVVLSRTIGHRLTTFLKERDRTGVVRYQDCAYTRDRAPLLETGFYYVEVYPNRQLQYILLTGGVDPLLQPVIQAVPDEHLSDPAPQTRELGVVEIDGRPGVFRRLRRFDNPHRRSEAVLKQMFPGFHCRPDSDVRSAYLYEWTPLN